MQKDYISISSSIIYMVKISDPKKNYTSSESVSCQPWLKSFDFQENQVPQTLQQMGEGVIF